METSGLIATKAMGIIISPKQLRRRAHKCRIMEDFPNEALGFWASFIVPLQYVNRMWGIRGSYYNIPRPIFYLLKVDYMPFFLCAAKCSKLTPFGEGRVGKPNGASTAVPLNPKP